MTTHRFQPDHYHNAIGSHAPRSRLPSFAKATTSVASNGPSRTRCIALALSTRPGSVSS